MKMKIAVPNKGLLAADCMDLLARMGVKLHATAGRPHLVPARGGKFQVLRSRPENIPELVEQGAADIGITGREMVRESESAVEELLPLGFGLCRLVVAAPEDRRYGSIEDLPARARIATSFPRLTEAFFKSKNQEIVAVPVSGSAELAPWIDIADAVTDLSQTGDTLRRNHLTLLDVVLDSEAVLIGGVGAMSSRKTEISDFVDGVESVQNASRKRYLMANVERSRLEAVTGIMPGIGGPTIMELAVEGKVAVHAVVDEDDLNALIPRLREAGASGILVLPIERLVP